MTDRDVRHSDRLHGRHLAEKVVWNLIFALNRILRIHDMVVSNEHQNECPKIIQAEREKGHTISMDILILNNALKYSLTESSIQIKDITLVLNIQ